MPFWGCSGTGKAMGLGPYITGVSKNDMYSCMKIPTTNIFIQNRPAHNLWSVAPITIDMPSGIAGATTGTLFMVGAIIALFSFTVFACGAPVVKWLGITLQNIWNTIGLYPKMDQKKVLVLI